MALIDIFGYFRKKKQTEALSDIFRLADPELLMKVKDIIMAIDIDKVNNIMNMLDVHKDGGLRVIVNIQIAKENNG